MRNLLAGSRPSLCYRRTKAPLLWMALFAASFLYAHGNPLSSHAVISVLTCQPHPEEVYTLYGHAALRVNDPQQGIDLVFNYGLFDFSRPHFIYRFAKGETDYMLGAEPYRDYVIQYQMRGSRITDQELVLTAAQKDSLWSALLDNYQPQNRTYRYNFFFDNCATRIPALIEKHLHGDIDWGEPTHSPTFRQMINRCTERFPWLTLGCDLAIGQGADRTATPVEQMFLPPYLEQGLARAVVTAPNGYSYRLIAGTSHIPAVQEEASGNTRHGTFTPLVCGWLLFGALLLLTFVERKRKKSCRWVDAILFTVAGLAGTVIAFLCFISTHPCMWPNWNIVWLHPLYLVGAALLTAKRFCPAARVWYFVTFVALSAWLAGWWFVPQHLNAAAFPLAAALWCRAGGIAFQQSTPRHP